MLRTNNQSKSSRIIANDAFSKDPGSPIENTFFFIVWCELRKLVRRESNFYRW